MSKEYCPNCGKKTVAYNFVTDMYECEECNFSNMYCQEERG